MRNTLFIWILVLLYISVYTAYSDDALVFDQGGDLGDGSSLASQLAEDYPMDWMGADDFFVDAQFDNHFITRINWWGFYDGGGLGAPEGFYLVIFTDNGGEPLGGPLQNIHYYIEGNPGYAPSQYQDDYLWAIYLPIGDCSETPNYTVVLNGFKQEHCSYSAEITIPDKFQITQNTTYWFCAQRKMYFDPYTQWYYSAYEEPHSNGYSALAGMYPTGYPYWSLVNDLDLALQLYGSEDPGGIESASLGEIKAAFR